MDDAKNMPPVLDYEPPQKRGWASMPRWQQAGAFVLICFAAGCALGTGKTGGSMLAVPFVWGGSVWYAIARIRMSETEVRERRWRTVIAVALLFLSPYVLVHSMVGPSVAFDLLQRGWHAKYVSDLDRIVVIVSLVLVGVYGCFDIRAIVRRFRRGSRAALNEMPPPSS